MYSGLVTNTNKRSTAGCGEKLSMRVRKVLVVGMRDRVDCRCVFFFFNDTATTEIYTLSLHDALPI